MAKYSIIKSFYASEAWTTLRKLLIVEREYKCERCKKVIKEPKDLIGHHKKELTPENVTDHMISLNPDNIEIICFDCHNKEHKRFGYSGRGRQVYLVYGPPLSGKASYVRENISRGDIVVDMDRLYESITMLPGYDKPDQLFSVVIGIHNKLLDNIKTRYGKWNNAWIVGGYADKYKRDKLADDIGAEIIFCDISKEECMIRLDDDETRKYRKDEWRGYIEKWFESYTK